MKIGKQILSILVSACFVAGMLPTASLAAEKNGEIMEASGEIVETSGLCEHHKAHDETCGYVEGSEESPCTHEHGAECYTEVISCIHTHTEDCYPAVDNGTSGGGTTDPDVEPGKDASPSDTEPGKDASPSDTEPGQDATSPDTESGEDAMSPDTGRLENEMPSGVEPGENVTSFEAEQGEPVALFEAEPGEAAVPTEAAGPTLCSHVCSVESGCIVQELNCLHEHDETCGYVPAVEGQPCTYVCKVCGPTEITAWSWVDELEAIDPDSGVLALSGAGAESPVLYDEIVALLPAKITATTEDGTETITLGRWTCPDYPETGAYTGRYKFTATLPDGYALAADAPALTVTVEFGGVAMLMDTTHAAHPICGASCTDTSPRHYNTQFPNWLASDYGTGSSLVLRVGGPTSTYGDPLETSGNAWILPAGTYYLADDIHIDKPIKIYGDVTICLNGYDISVGKDIYAFEIDKKNAASPSGKLTLTDCKENRGEVKSDDTANPAYGCVTIISDKNCTFNMYGGTIKGTKRGVYVNDYGTFNMYGGVISDTADCGVVVTDSHATCNMYGGEISRNRNYGVEVEKYAKFNMYGGVIKDITTRNSNANISGVYCKGSYFNMHGGMISGCKRGVHVTCNSDNPNIPVVPGEFTMDGGTIKENEIGVSLYAYFYDNKVLKSPDFTMTGGEIINNTDIGVDMGCYTDGGTNSPYGAGGHLFVGGTAKVQSNSKYNVYFDFSKGEIKLATSAALTEGAYIGITTGTLPTEGNPLLIATGYSENEITDYFHSDRDGYVIVCTNTDDPHNTHTLNLTVSPHTHDWTYMSIDMSTVEVSCNGTTGTCDYRATPATVTIRTAQSVYEYDKNMAAPVATLTHSANWPSDLTQAKESDIKYWKSTDGGSSYTVQITNKEDLKTPGKYLAQLKFNGIWLEAYFSVVDNSKKDPVYTAPTAKTGLTYNGQAQALINPGKTNGGKMQYKLDSGEYSTSIPKATNARKYTVYYKVVGDATYNDTIEQSITVTIKQATPAGKPTFTPVTEAGKTIGDVKLTAPAGWPAGTFSWLNGETGLSATTPITKGTSYHWIFLPDDTVNYTSTGGNLVLWSNTGGGNSGGNSGSSSGGGNSSNTVGGDDGSSSGENGSNMEGGNDSVSSGGNSSSSNDSDIESDNGSGSNNNIPATPVTIPVSGDEKTIRVDAVVSGTTATIANVDFSKLDTVIGDKVKTGVVTIDFSVLEKKVDTVKLPANVVKQIAEAVNDPNNDAESLEIVLPDGTSIEFDAKALGSKKALANGADITISIKRTTDRTLNDKQKQAVGGRPAWDIIVTSGGRNLSDIGGRITVSAPYELPSGEQAGGIVVYYVDGKGNMERCETSYDPVKKRVTWKTNHLSVYMIGYDKSKESSGTGGAAASYVTCTVQKGDTLWIISRKYGCTVSEIVAANRDLIKKTNLIYPGWKLKIPQY